MESILSTSSLVSLEICRVQEKTIETVDERMTAFLPIGALVSIKKAIQPDVIGNYEQRGLIRIHRTVSTPFESIPE